MTREWAAAKEETFFSTDTFFGSECVASVKERFGVTALRGQLSRQLVALTQRELPKMKAALESTLQQVRLDNASNVCVCGTIPQITVAQSSMVAQQVLATKTAASMGHGLNTAPGMSALPCNHMAATL